MKKIIILGHGKIRKDVKKPCYKNVHFYVNEGDLLDAHFIPTFIQVVLGELDTPTAVDYIQKSHLECKESHYITTKKYKYEHYIFSNGEYMNQVPCSNKLFHGTINYHNVQEEKKQSIHQLFKRDTPPQKIKICDTDFYHYICGKDNDVVIIYPTDKNIDAISLTNIISWAETEYSDEDLEFYWMACREFKGE